MLLLITITFFLVHLKEDLVSLVMFFLNDYTVNIGIASNMGLWIYKQGRRCFK